MGKIHELVTRPDRLRQGQEEELRQVLLPFEDEIPGQIFREIMKVIDRRSASRRKWTFVMLSPEQNGKVVEYLAANSTQPLVAVRVWALCFQYLRIDTGEVMLTRDELAEKVGVRPEHLSRVMGELEAFGAITRRRQKVGGMKGPGMARYFMNPRVATHLAGAERDKAQDDAPLLRLIEGTAAPWI